MGAQPQVLPSPEGGPAAACGACLLSCHPGCGAAPGRVKGQVPAEDGWLQSGGGTLYWGGSLASRTVSVLRRAADGGG